MTAQLEYYIEEVLINNSYTTLPRSGQLYLYLFCFHYSDGLGRTGTFCALMMCYDRFKTEHMADVFYSIKTMRAQRPGMVENTVRSHHVYNLCKILLYRLNMSTSIKR